MLISASSFRLSRKDGRLTSEANRATNAVQTWKKGVPLGEISVFAPSVANLWAVIDSYGIEPKGLFREHGLDMEFPMDSGVRIPYRQIDRIRARAAEIVRQLPRSAAA